MTAEEFLKVAGGLVSVIGAGGLGAWLHRTWGTFEQRAEAKQREREAERADDDGEREAWQQLIERYRSELDRLTARVTALESQVVELRSELHVATRDNERLRSELIQKEAALSAAIVERDTALAKLAKLERKATAKKKKVRAK